MKFWNEIIVTSPEKRLAALNGVGLPYRPVYSYCELRSESDKRIEFLCDLKSSDKCNLISLLIVVIIK